MPNSPNVDALSPVLETSDNTNQPIDLTDPIVQLVKTIVQTAVDRKGEDITLLDVRDISTLADYFVIITGFSKVQVRAIARTIQDSVEEELQRLPVRMAGQSEGSWVLQDYGDVIVHVQMPQERDFYDLEAFWGHAKRVSLTSLAS